MKVAINVEFTDEEIVKHAADIGRRIIGDFARDMAQTLGKLPPGFMTDFIQACSRSGKINPPSPSPSPSSRKSRKPRSPKQ